MKKKRLRLFNKKTLLYVGPLDYAQSKKHLATAKQLIRKNSACHLKIGQFFSQSERVDRLHPLSPCSF